MNKRELDLLEAVFAKEIDGGVYQTKSQLAKRLEKEGYLQKVTLNLGRDRFGSIEVTGYVLTILGNATYCMSERCAEAGDF